MASTEHPVALQDPALWKTLRSPTFQPMPSQCSGLSTGSSMLLSAGFECPSSTLRPQWPRPLRWTGVWTDSHLGKRSCLRNTGPRVLFVYPYTYHPSSEWGWGLSEPASLGTCTCVCSVLPRVAPGHYKQQYSDSIASTPESISMP